MLYSGNGGYVHLWMNEKEENRDHGSGKAVIKISCLIKKPFTRFTSLRRTYSKTHVRAQLLDYTKSCPLWDLRCLRNKWNIACDTKIKVNDFPKMKDFEYVLCWLLPTGLVILFWFWDTRAAFLFISLFLLHPYTCTNIKFCIQIGNVVPGAIFSTHKHTYIPIWPCAHTYTLTNTWDNINLSVILKFTF